MSRSIKHTKITGITCAKSEKKDKQFANRRLRRIAKQEVYNCKEYEDYCPVLQKEVSNVWGFAKDGKYYWEDLDHIDSSWNSPVWQRMGK